MPSVSVVITTYKRDNLLKRTLGSIRWADEIIVVDDANETCTRMLCEGFGVNYIPRIGRPDVEFSNPAVPINIGLNAAKGEIVVLQNAECEHLTDVVQQFRERIQERVAVFAKVKSLDEHGEFENWYIAPGVAERPYFFCGAMLRKHFLELGGMDENFSGPGYEDDDFAVRMRKAGICSEFADDILVNHQWHPRPALNFTPSAELYRQKHGVNLLW